MSVSAFPGILARRNTRQNIVGHDVSVGNLIIPILLVELSYAGFATIM